MADHNYLFPMPVSPSPTANSKKTEIMSYPFPCNLLLRMLWHTTKLPLRTRIPFPPLLELLPAVSPQLVSFFWNFTQLVAFTLIQ